MEKIVKVKGKLRTFVWNNATNIYSDDYVEIVRGKIFMAKQKVDNTLCFAFFKKRKDGKFYQKDKDEILHLLPEEVADNIDLWDVLSKVACVDPSRK